jgi:hypothetical protein
MDHARVITVEGNQVIIGVEEKFYLEKLTDQTRLAWVERAISRVTDTPLRVRYVLADDLDLESPHSDLLDDPLIQEGLELGGQIQDVDE